MEREVKYKWHPIEDYSVSPDHLRIKELVSLSEVWKEQKESLESLETIVEFNERLKREWAIETGLLERIYTLDRGVTQLLLEKGIDASLIPHGKSNQDTEHIVAIIRDQESTIEGLFQFVKGERELTTSYVKDLHSQLTRNQTTTTAIDQFGNRQKVKLLSGEYKKLPNNPIRPDGTLHEYCPPVQVNSEMDRLINLFHEHMNTPPEVEAAWLHHRFTQIHPFQDGNGRVARALASIVFIKAGWFPLVIRDIENERVKYIEALETADRGNLEPLVYVFANAQKKAFIEALGISSHIKKTHRVEQEIGAIRKKLEVKARAKLKEWESVKQIAGELQQCVDERLDEVVGLLQHETRHIPQSIEFYKDNAYDGNTRDYYFRIQIIEVANKLGYYANTRDYRSWSRLVLKSDNQSEILISFHATGYEFRGVLAASACFFRREEAAEDERQITGIFPLSDDIFQFNYKEKIEDVQPRFKEWLENILTVGLEIWREDL